MPTLRYAHLTTPDGRPVPLTADQQALVAKYLGIVAWAANRWPGLRKMVGDDFDGVAGLAICEAARRFDPAAGCEFSTYAINYVRGFLMTAAFRNSDVIRNKSADAHEQSRLVVMSIDAAARGCEGDMARLFGAVPDAPPLDADEVACVEAALKLLPPREAHVVREVYWGGRSLKEVGADLGLTKERVRQIRDAALARLRSMLCLTPAGVTPGDAADQSGDVGTRRNAAADAARVARLLCDGGPLGWRALLAACGMSVSALSAALRFGEWFVRSQAGLWSVTEKGLAACGRRGC